MKSKESLNEEICVHILTVSSAMLGVCITVIGVVRVVISIRKADLIVDDILSIDALLFLGACLTSYIALRSRNVSRMHRTEKVADMLFLSGLILMAASCLLITYSIAAA